MAHENRPPSGPYRSGYEERDGRMYDDRHSRSRSVERGHYGDHSRNVPRGPAADRRHDYSGDRDRDYRLRRDDFRRSPPSVRRGRQGYRDRDREGYRSPEYASRSRSRSGSRSRGRHHHGHGHGHVQESREVIMEGLPVDMVEEDISNELLDYYHVQGLEDVRVIRDRQTRVSRQIGFLRFTSLNDSRNFMERNAPMIYLYGRHAGNEDRAAKVRISFTRERDDRRSRPEGEWTCRNCSFDNFSTRQKCFRCQADRADAEMPAEEMPARVVNIGDNDVAPDNTPSQFVLFRGLDNSVTEELFAKGVTKLYKASNSDDQNAQGAAKKAKVASTTSDTNLGAREGSLRRVLLVRDRRSNESWKFGFAEFATVDDAQAALTKLNSFEKFTIASKPVLASYIHAGVFVPVLNPTPSTARFTFSPLSNPGMKLAYWDEEGYVTELVVSTEELNKPKADAKSGKDAEKAKKRKAEASSSAGIKKTAMPSHLQFWSDRHAELHGIQKKDGDDNGESAKESEGGSPAPPTRSYADPHRHCCYLCMRQFKSGPEVNRHERLSQLHRDNLQKEDLVAKALAKLEKHRNDQPGDHSTTEYRDRAKERRHAFGSSRQTSKPKPSTPAAAAKEEEPAPAPTAPSKGAALLSKMGWSAGSGLGAQGTGMTAPIAADVYAQGVGLGAQGSKLGEASEEAARNTRGRYDEFLEKTKDLARERYERMS